MCHVTCVTLLQVISVFADEGKVGLELLDSEQTPPPQIKVRTECAPLVRSLVSVVGCRHNIECFYKDMLPIGSAAITSRCPHP